jgi:hypothetical protein
MFRVVFIFCALTFSALSFVYGQSDPAKEVPSQETQKGKANNAADTKNSRGIKSVPTTNPGGAKPGKISSAARPSTIRPNQPINTGKPPVKGKPANTGKPPGK